MSKGATHVTLMDPRLTPGTAVTAVGGFDPEAVAAYSGSHNERGIQIYACKKESHSIECVTEVFADCCCIPVDPTLNAHIPASLNMCINYVRAIMPNNCYICTEHHKHKHINK